MIRLRAQHLLKLTSEAYPGLISYIDKDFRYQFASPKYLDWFGMDPESLIGRTVPEVIGADFFIQRKHHMDQALRGHKETFIGTINHRTLGMRDIEQIYQPDLDEDGTILGFIAMAYDITEERKAQRLATENEARFRSLTEVIPQLVWISDAEGKMTFFNHHWPRVTNTKMEDNLGHGWINVIHHEDRVSTLLSWREALKGGSLFETEYRILMGDGKYRWHMARGLPIRNELGEIDHWVGTTTDIEAQKTAKEVAVAERKKIYSLFMQAPVVILVMSGPDHVVELLNPVGLKYVGARQIIGRSIRESVPELAEQGLIDLIDEIYYSGQGRSIKAQPLKLKQGQKLEHVGYFDLFYEPIRDDNGLTTGILCMAMNVSEQVEALRRAEESEELFRTYAESMPQMAFILDAGGESTYLNHRWFEYAGPDFKWEDIYHPEDYVTVVDRWKTCLTAGKPFEGEFRLQRKDGSYRWHLSRAVPLKDSKGNILQWVGTCTDIHDQKEIESVQARLLQVLDSSTDFIGMADVNGKAMYLNRSGREMIGLDQDMDISHLKITDFFFPEDIAEVSEVIMPTTLEEGKWVGDFRFRHFRTGEERWVHYNSFKTHDDKTGEFTGFATVSRDLTDIKQKERSLEEALKARDQFLSIASHELKTPLTSLKLQAQLTLRSLEASKDISPDKQVTLARQTNDLVGRLNRLIDDMLDVSRIKTGKLQLDNSEQELGNIVREVVLRMSLLFEAAGLSLPSITVPEKLIGDWDRFRLEQVIGNLLTNAIRYGQGKPIEIKAVRTSDRALLSVTDHGYGIHQKDLERIFGRFERAINSSEVSGLGLGLFISKEIIESQGGRVWVESELGQGSTFYVELPLK